jgi:hypothetical protein
MRPHRFRLFFAAVFISSTAIIASAAEPHVEHYFRVVDGTGQPVQYGYLCLTPAGLTQRCAAIDPFGPTVFVLPESVRHATVTVHLRGVQHTEELRLDRGGAPYVITVPAG